MRVALYTRVSREEQARNGLSLGDQLTALREFAKREKYVVVGEYTDPGISARKRYTKRPGLMKLMENAAEFDLVLFTKLDRWVRSVRDYYSVQDVLDANKVSWKAILEDYETVTASGRLKVNIMLSVAQDEADRTSERIKFTFAEKRARGESTNGRAPLGYRIVKGRPEPDDNADAAKDMFAQYLRSGSIPATVRYMRETWRIQKAYKNIRNALANPIYSGKFLDTECPAIIDIKTWSAVQGMLKTRGQRNATKHTFLSHGVLRCAECGRAMNASWLIKGGKEYIYYRCSGQMTGQACEHRKRVREDNLEHWLLQNMVPEAKKYNIKIDAPQDDGRKDRIKAKMEKLKDLYLSDLIDRETYASDYSRLKAELESIHSAPKSEINIDRLITAIQAYVELSRKGKKEFWRRTIREVRATNDGRFFVELF